MVIYRKLPIGIARNGDEAETVSGGPVKSHFNCRKGAELACLVIGWTLKTASSTAGPGE